MANVLDSIGKFGPLILVILSILLLLHKKVFLMYYIIGVITNTVLNIILKILIKDPRPKEDTVSRLQIDKYGMPSGHCQSVGFSTSYIYFTLYNSNMVLLYTIIAIITMYQRYKCNCHTISQIVIGFIVGIGIGILFIYIALQRIKGTIHGKEDDNAFFV